jgi:hypothetical protein
MGEKIFLIGSFQTQQIIYISKLLLINYFGTWNESIRIRDNGE